MPATQLPPASGPTRLVSPNPVRQGASPMSLHRPNRRKPSRRTWKSLIEALEPRMLLTAVTSGHFFEMRDASGQVLRIKVVGPPNAHVDLTGATMVVAPVGSAEDLQ